MANKIIEGLKEAVEVAKCEHSLVIQPRLQTTAPPKLDRYFCTKCHATVWTPIESWRH